MRPVAVGGVHQQMAEERHRYQQDPPPLRSEHAGLHPRKEPQTGPDHETKRGKTRECVAVAAMVQEIAERRLGDAGVEQIHVRRVRRNDTRRDEDDAGTRRGVARRGVFAHRGPDESMRDIVHVTLMLSRHAVTAFRGMTGLATTAAQIHFGDSHTQRALQEIRR